VGPTVFGHAGSADVTAVGAVPAPLFYRGEPEHYSSRGPVSHYFGPVVDTNPAATLDPPKIISKPDLAATDCGVTTFFGSLFEEQGGELDRRFCGTSAAAPHAAAIAALMLGEPAATPSEVRNALTGSATRVGAFEPCAVGAGLIDAVAAIELLRSEAEAPPSSSCMVPEQQPWTVLEERRTEGVSIPVAPVEEIPASVSPTPIPGAPTRRIRPSTGLRRHPPSILQTASRTAEAVFLFGSNQSGVTFLCEVDRGRFHPCPTRFVRRYSVGRHVLRVKARSSGGETDGTPAVFHFRVEHRP
jgi:hypothetical protein